MAQLTILKKVSVATVNKLPKGGFKGVEGEKFVMRILGQARAYEVVSTAFGESIKFKGEFRAWGEAHNECAGSVAYLPTPLDEMLVSVIEAAEGAPVEFGFDVDVIPDEASSVGYVYRLRTLTECKASDPVARLAASVAPMPALAAPEPTPELEAAKDPAPAQEAGKGGKAGK